MPPRNDRRGATIGILGDGQLGRMMAHAAQRKGFKVHGFGQDRHSPLGQVTAYFTQARCRCPYSLCKRLRYYNVRI